MAVYLAALVAMCTLVVLWAIGLDPDTGALISVVILLIGIAVHMFKPSTEET